MATVDKNFKVKNGLVVEGTTATVNGEDIITTGSTTDNLGEGSTNLYYTDVRAKGAAAELLTGATLTNITITGNEDGLTITAENGGIQDLTGFDTDDLTEGTTNLYFTDARAQSAVASDIATAKSEAIAEASLYADGLAVNYEVAGAASTAETNANSYTDSEIDALTTDDIEEGSTNLYFTNQRALDATASAYDAAGAADTALSDAQAYADGLVQGLNVKEPVRTASTADIDLTVDAPSTIGGVTISNGDRVLLKDQSPGTENGIYVYNSSTKRLTRAEDQETPEKGDYTLVISGTYAATGWLVFNVDLLLTGINWTQFSAANEYTASTGITITGNAISVTADTYDAFGAAAQALSDAEDYADGLASNYEAAGSITTAIDALDTDDIEEGSENLYFTDYRAIDAIEAVVPQFTSVDINSLVKQVASQISWSEGSTETVHSFDKTKYRSAEYLVKLKSGTDTEISKILLTLDTSDNIAITEYGTISTDGSLGSITADISGSNVRLRVTGASGSSGTVFATGTLIADTEVVIDNTPAPSVSAFVGPTDNWYGQSNSNVIQLRGIITAENANAQTVVANPTAYKVVMTGGSFAGESALSNAVTDGMFGYLVVTPATPWLGLSGFGSFGASGVGNGGSDVGQVSIVAL